MYPLIDLDALLMSPEPPRPFSHRRMLDRNAGRPERVHDQPGRVAIRLRKERGVRCSGRPGAPRSEEHTSELQSRLHLVCRLLLEKKKTDAVRALRASPGGTSR